MNNEKKDLPKKESKLEKEFEIKESDADLKASIEDAEKLKAENTEKEISLDEAKEIVEATDNKNLEDEEMNIENKVFALDYSLKNEDETDDEFIERGKAENLGHWIEKEDLESPLKKEEMLKSLIDYIIINRLNIDRAMCMVASMYGEKSDVWKSLFISKAWLGKLLGQLGSENPYTTKEKIKQASQIPPTADVYDNPKEMHKFSLESILDKVLMVRENIHNLTDAIAETDLTQTEVKNGRLAAIALTNSYVNLCEANFELGYQLSLIRKG